MHRLGNLNKERNVLHEDLTGFRPQMMEMMIQAVKDACDYCNDMSADAGDDFEQASAMLSLGSIFNNSVFMFASMLDPDFDFDTSKVPESVKKALERLVLERVQVRFK